MEETEEDGGRRGGRKMEQNHMEKLQEASDLMAREESSVVVYLPNLGMQLINIITEFCVICMDLLVLEIYYNTTLQAAIGTLVHKHSRKSQGDLWLIIIVKCLCLSINLGCL